MSLLTSCSDYVRALDAARKIHGAGYFSAVSSILRAKFQFNLGPRRHALYGLMSVPRQEWGNYKIDRDLENLLARINPKPARTVTKDKLLFFKHCSEHEIPIIETLYSDVSDTINTENDRKKQFCCAVDSGPESIFFKLIDGAHGWGAFVAKRQRGKWHFCGEIGSTEELFDFCQQRKGNKVGWLLQPVVSTHPDLLDISSSDSLSTVRVITCLKESGPQILFAAIKLVGKGNLNDNFDVGTTGNTIAAVDLNSGELGPAKGSLNRIFPYIESFDIHPDTGEKVAGRVVPYWEKTKHLLLRAQSTLPVLKSIGWDVAITKAGPVVVEGNANYGSETLEVAYGRGLRKELLEQLSELV